MQWADVYTDLHCRCYREHVRLEFPILSLNPGLRLNNVVAGLVLAWDKSIKFGDVISLPDGFTGEITRQSLRYTQLTDRNQVNVLVPNSIMTTRELTNFTRDSGDKKWTPKPGQRLK